MPLNHMEIPVYRPNHVRDTIHPKLAEWHARGEAVNDSLVLSFDARDPCPGWHKQETRCMEGIAETLRKIRSPRSLELRCTGAGEVTLFFRALHDLRPPHRFLGLLTLQVATDDVWCPGDIISFSGFTLFPDLVSLIATSGSSTPICRRPVDYIRMGGVPKCDIDVVIKHPQLLRAYMPRCSRRIGWNGDTQSGPPEEFIIRRARDTWNWQTVVPVIACRRIRAPESVWFSSIFPLVKTILDYITAPPSVVTHQSHLFMIDVDCTLRQSYLETTTNLTLGKKLELILDSKWFRALTMAEPLSLPPSKKRKLAVVQQIPPVPNSSTTVNWSKMSDGQLCPWQRDWLRHILETRNVQVLSKKQPDTPQFATYLVTNYYVKRYVPANLQSKTGANDWGAIALFLLDDVRKNRLQECYSSWQLSKHFTDYHRPFERPLPYGQNGNRRLLRLTLYRVHVDTADPLRTTLSRAREPRPVLVPASDYLATFLTLKEQARMCRVMRACRGAFKPIQAPVAPIQDDDDVEFALERLFGFPSNLTFSVAPFSRHRY